MMSFLSKLTLAFSIYILVFLLTTSFTGDIKLILAIHIPSTLLYLYVVSKIKNKPKRPKYIQDIIDRNTKDDSWERSVKRYKRNFWLVTYSNLYSEEAITITESMLNELNIKCESELEDE